MTEHASSDPIEVSDRVELRITDRDTGEVRRYRSVVTDVMADDFGVALPTEQQVPLLLPNGTPLQVSVWKGFADHLFPSRVVGRQAGQVPLLRLARPQPHEIQRAPRRDYFRAEARLPVHLRLDEQPDGPRLAAVMADVSGGGCRLRLPRALPVGASVHLDFDLPLPTDREGNDLTRPVRDLLGRVRSCQRVARPGRGAEDRSHHLAGVEFPLVDNVTRNTLLRYVAFRQREMLKQLAEGQAPEPGTPRQQRTDELRAQLEELEQHLRRDGHEVLQSADGPTAEALIELEPADAPLEPVPAGPQAGALVMPPTSTPNGRTVLLVEDEQEQREVLAEVLQARGYAVAQAGNGQEGLAAAVAVRPDVVITDLLMPRMNGWRLVAGLRERGLQMPVLVITGYMNQEGHEVFTNRQIAGFLLKPVDLEHMVRMVNGVFVAPEGRPTRILVVGEPGPDRDQVTSVLDGAGYVVDAVANGREVPAGLDTFHPDLVLIDADAPQEGGFEVARRLRSTPSTGSLPIVVVTGNSTPDHVRTAIRLRLNGYLVRPFAAATLLERVHGVLQVRTPA